MHNKLQNTLSTLQQNNKIKIIQNTNPIQFMDLKTKITYTLTPINKNICECGALTSLYQIKNDNDPQSIDFCINCLIDSLNIKNYDNNGWSII